MALLIPAVRRSRRRPVARRSRFPHLAANPTVWLERIVSPLLTEFLQVVYTLFVPAVLLDRLPACGESGRSASSNIMLF